MPTGVNLNRYSRPSSCIRWHSDNEPLFGPQNAPKLIVGMSLGNSVEFKVRRRMQGKVPSLITLDHGDLLVMDGLTQSEYVHCTASGLQVPRVNLTYRWVAQHIVWSRFRMMRRYLAYCPEEEPSIFRMLDLISRGAQGHGPVHLLLVSAAELGFAWDCNGYGFCLGFPPSLRMVSGPVQHFRSAILEAWCLHVFAKLSERKGFWSVGFADLKGSLQLLTSSHLRERDKMLLRTILCGRVWNGFLLGKAKKEDVPCRFCGKRDGDGHLFWECSFPSPSACARTS